MILMRPARRQPMCRHCMTESPLAGIPDRVLISIPRRILFQTGVRPPTAPISSMQIILPVVWQASVLPGSFTAVSQGYGVQPPPGPTPTGHSADNPPAAPPGANDIVIIGDNDSIWLADAENPPLPVNQQQSCRHLLPAEQGCGKLRYTAD